MAGIPVKPLGKFVFVGRREAIDDVLMMEIQREIEIQLAALKEGMMVYQRPRRPIPSARIPMAAAPYRVSLTKISKVLEREKLLLKKSGLKSRSRLSPKGRKKIGGLRGFIIRRRNEYHIFKRNWVKMWAKPTGEKWSWKTRNMTEEQLEKYRIDKKEKMRKRKEMYSALERSGVGKFFGFRSVIKRGKKPKMKFLDKIFPIQRRRSRLSGKTKPGTITVLVKPGRLRRAAGRGLIWHGNAFVEGVTVQWGIPYIGGGRFYNYAKDVEMNPSAGMREGSGHSPYVERVRKLLVQECKTISIGVSELYRNNRDIINYGIEYKDDYGYRLPYRKNVGDYVVVFLPA